MFLRERDNIFMINKKAGLVLYKDMLEFIFEAAHIQRWNDHIRPQGFTELDKQAHKMMILYVLARYEEKEHDVKLDWQVLIEGGIFELFHRIVLTDIKPPVFHELMRRSGPALNKWVYGELATRVPSLVGTDFFRKMQSYFDEGKNLKEKKILRAAHYLATEWEFRIVYHLNQGMYGLEETKCAIASELEDHYDLAGVQKIALGCKTRNFIDFIGQLRFQKRWSQSPRVPETSVMGHVLIVAVLSYFCTLNIGGCKQRLINNFLGGLWHDLPEVLTRDIISPVKRSVKGLDELIKEIEQRQVEEKILPLLPIEWHQDIINFTNNEFANRVVLAGKLQTIEGDIPEKYNQDTYSAVDGQLLKGCDHLAAFLEAWLSIEYGITSKHLEGAVEQLREDYANRRIAGIPFGEIYKQFL